MFGEPWGGLFSSGRLSADMMMSKGPVHTHLGVVSPLLVAAHAVATDQLDGAPRMRRVQAVVIRHHLLAFRVCEHLSSRERTRLDMSLTYRQSLVKKNNYLAENLNLSGPSRISCIKKPLWLLTFSSSFDVYISNVDIPLSTF